MIKHFKQMSAGIADRTRIAIREIQILFAHVPNVGLNASKQCWVSQVAFSRHHRVRACAFNTTIHVGLVLDVAVGDHGNVDSGPTPTSQINEYTTRNQ